MIFLTKPRQFMKSTQGKCCLEGWEYYYSKFNHKSKKITEDKISKNKIYERLVREQGKGKSEGWKIVNEKGLKW